MNRLLAQGGEWRDYPKSLYTAPIEIVKLLIEKEKMLNAYLKAVQKCQGYDNGNSLSKVLPWINKLSEQQANNLISAYKNNEELRKNWGFNGAKPAYYGQGVAYHLNRLTGKS